jgi:hypothetical protein
LLIGQVLRACSFLAVERLVRASARRALAVSRSFSDDALDYFTERLDPTVTRVALARVLHRAKRNKAFETSAGIGLAVDGSTVGWCASAGCSLCRPHRNADDEITGYQHHVVLASVVGTELSLPFDVEPYGPGDSEYAAGQSMLVEPSNCSASVSPPMWLSMGNTPPLLFSMLLVSWACRWWLA